MEDENASLPKNEMFKDFVQIGVVVADLDKATRVLDRNIRHWPISNH